MVSIRQVREDDLDAVYGVCLATGESGRDASLLYSDPQLIGNIYAAPYLVLEPQLAFVATDDEGVAGYVVGVADTQSWETKLERDWWPALRRRYTDPDERGRSEWTPEQRLMHLIHHPGAVPAAVCKLCPAHLHMNLLPRLQGQGVGLSLLDAWMTAARASGVRAAHVGVSPTNLKGTRFWMRAGFVELLRPHDSDGALWLGRLL